MGRKSRAHHNQLGYKTRTTITKKAAKNTETTTKTVETSKKKKRTKIRIKTTTYVKFYNQLRKYLENIFRNE